jgi:hypothetical protein
MTQLTAASGYNTSNMIFSDPQCGSIPDSKPAISFKRINIQTRNSDGSVGDLILSTEKIFSFGVCENTNMETGKVNGYVLPLCLYNKDFPTASEKEFVTTFNNIVDKIKSHLIEHRESFEQEDLDERDLKKLNPLYYKKEKGKVVDKAGPTLYAKLIMSKKLNKITTMFFDPNTGSEIDPLELIGKFGFATTAIKFESIFIGNKISLQIKVHECEFELQQTGFKRLLSSRPVSKPEVVIQPQATQNMNTPVFDNGSLNSDSDSDSDEESSATTPTITESITKQPLTTPAATPKTTKVQAPVKKK